MSLKISKELKDYYEQTKNQSPKCPRLVVKNQLFDALLLRVWSLQDPPPPQKKSLFCSCSEDSVAENPSQRKRLISLFEQDLKAQSPIVKFRKIAQKIIDLKIAKGLERNPSLCILQEAYWTERFPPHYPLDLRKFLFDSWKKSSIPCTFEQWIKTNEGQHFAGLHSTLHQKPISYILQLNPAQRRNYLLSLDRSDPQNPKFLNAEGTPMKGEFMIVIGPNETVYGAHKEQNRLHHSSFFKGAPVIFAGTVLSSKEGVIEWIAGISGHYRRESYPKDADTLKTACEILRTYYQFDDRIGRYSSIGIAPGVYVSAWKKID